MSTRHATPPAFIETTLTMRNIEELVRGGGY